MKDLIRRGADAVLNAPPSWFDEIDQAAFSASDMQAVAQDPVLRTSVIRHTRRLLRHWAAANLAEPGEPVRPLFDDLNEAARSMVYRGQTEAIVDSYRLGQNIAWRRWMKIAFSLTSDSDVLAAMLDITAASIGSFIDATITGLTAQITDEREQFLRGREAKKLEAASVLINGGHADLPSTELVLGYRLNQVHTAVVVWTTDASPRLSELERAADDVSQHLSATSMVRVVASPGTVWAWLGAIDIGQLRNLESVVGMDSRWKVAVGSHGHGLDGFRTSHLDAVITQRMMARMNTPHGVATFDDVEGVLLLTSSPDRADRFVAHTLGPLENAHPELRESVRAYLSHQCNASKAADSLYSHRNTVLRRVKHADELLPRTIEDNALNIAMALEIKHWRGALSDETDDEAH
ncbi:PucR family transcriptional regulator [Mycobacterium sp. C31M]